MWKKKYIYCFRKQNKKITEKWSRLTRLAFVSWSRRWTEIKKMMRNQIKNPNPNREKREKRAIERREERIKIKRRINLIYMRDVIFAFCECRERERERQRFLEREPLELELVMGPTVFVLFFWKYKPSPRVDCFSFFFFNGETVVLTSEESFTLKIFFFFFKTSIIQPNNFSIIVW